MSARKVCSLRAFVLMLRVKYLSILTVSGASSAHSRKLERPSPKSSSANDMPDDWTSRTEATNASTSEMCSCSVISSVSLRGDRPSE